MKIIISVIGITKTLTVPFDFFHIIVSVVEVTKTITIPFGCLLRLL
jgi:hypothetical protein